MAHIVLLKMAPASVAKASKTMRTRFEIPDNYSVRDFSIENLYFLLISTVFHLSNQITHCVVLFFYLIRIRMLNLQHCHGFLLIVNINNLRILSIIWF